MSILTIVLAGGQGKSLSALTAGRGKPELPFGAKYRLIDFVLSNIAHSGLDQVAILAQRQTPSMAEHIGDGKPWGFETGLLQTWLPSLERTGHEHYIGTADAVYQNQRYIAELGCELVLIVSGDHIYCQDYGNLIRFHREKGASLTIATMPVPAGEVQRFGILNVDDNKKITWFIEKPGAAQSHQASKGIYVFETKFLLAYLEEDARTPDSTHDFGRDVIARMVETGNVYAYPFTTYWADMGTVDLYWKTNLALLGDEPVLALHDPAWPVLTRTVQKPPTTIRPAGHVMNSLVSEGCVIDGEVMHSVLSPGVRVERGAVVRDAVILHDTVIRAGAMVCGCILDKEVCIDANAHIGAGGDLTPNSQEPEVLRNGITVIGKGAHIPQGLVVGRNCRIDPHVSAKDFEAMGFTPHAHIPSGTTITRDEK
ncbi:MAG: glucose-1-phosphate adenylyltransferase family protein [Chloroflexota bacterium]